MQTLNKTTPRKNMKTQKEIQAAMKTLQKFIGTAQWDCLRDFSRAGEESVFFGEELCRLAKRVEAMPTSYQTDGQGDAAKVWLHYFNCHADWYIIEKDSDPACQQQAFGMADLGHGGELGYISLPELLAAGVELDFYFTPRTLAELKREKYTTQPTVASYDTRRAEFDQQIKDLCAAILQKATRQFEYNEQTNVPKGIIQAGDSVSFAVQHGVIAALSERNKWGIEPTIELAADLLEDVNAHPEAATVRAFLNQPVTA